MALTNSQVIQDALGMLGVTDDFNITAEQGALGLRVMNDMLLQWEDNDIHVGYGEQDTLTDTSPILPAHMLAVKSNLAIALAPYYPAAPMTPALAEIAQSSHQKLQRMAQSDLLGAVDLDHTHTGLPGGRYNITTDS